MQSAVVKIRFLTQTECLIMKNIRPVLSSLVVACSALLLSGCDPKTDSTAAANGSATSAEPAAATPPNVDINADDTMRFNVTRIEAAPGESIKLTLHNVGRMPKASMGHNWVLLKSDADARAYSIASMSAVKTDYLPEAKSDEVIVHTRLLGPGESDTITFDAPSEPGSYPFLCSFPGHFLSGMEGVLIVK